MPVIKDVRCVKCNSILEMLIDGEQTGVMLHCEQCDKVTVHQSLCNGGLKNRYRFNDWSGFDPEGYVEYLGCRAGQARKEDIVHLDDGKNDGEGTRVWTKEHTERESRDAKPWGDIGSDKAYHDAPRFQPEAVKERRAIRKAKKRREEGRAPIVMDMTK
jgi:hypothetical protein